MRIRKVISTAVTAIVLFTAHAVHAQYPEGTPLWAYPTNPPGFKPSPDDGVPRQFALTADVVDAWTRIPAQRIGSVFLSRIDTAGGPKINALSSVCPHLGCAVDYDVADGQFQCPCHASAFTKDGAKLLGPSLRGLDPLPVKLIDNGDQQEIWVEPERFRAGIAERVPIG